MKRACSRQLATLAAVAALCAAPDSKARGASPAGRIFTAPGFTAPGTAIPASLPDSASARPRANSARTTVLVRPDRSFPVADREATTPRLSAPGYGVTAAAATDGSSGTVVAVWAQRRRGRSSMWFSERGEAGWTPRRMLARQRPGERIDSIDIDAGRDGTLTVVWSTRRPRRAGVIQAARRAPGKPFGDATTVGAGPVIDPDALQLAADDRGNAVAIWGRVTSRGEIVVAVRRNTTWLRAQVVGRSNDLTTAEIDAAGVGDGSLTTAWLAERLDDAHVRIARVQADGRLALATLRVASERVYGDQLALATRSDGTLLVGIRAGFAGAQALIVSPANDVQEQLRDEATAWPPVVAMSPAGDAAMAWGRIEDPGDFVTAIAEEGQEFAPPAALVTDADITGVFDPAVTISDEGALALAITGFAEQGARQPVRVGLHPRGGVWRVWDPIPRQRLRQAEIAGVAIVGEQVIAVILGGARTQRVLATN